MPLRKHPVKSYLLLLLLGTLAPFAAANENLVIVKDDPPGNGIAEPSIEYDDLGRGWMAYTAMRLPDIAETRIALSMDNGGELPTAVEQHTLECADCREWQARAHQLRRRTLRSVEAGAVPEIEIEQYPSRFRLHRYLRFALAWAGVLLVVWNVADTVSPGSTVAIHAERHQAAFGVALGLAFLFVAWRPDRAYGMVPFAVTFTFALSFSAIIDLANGDSTLLKESQHVVELAGLAVLWVLGTAAGPGRKKSA